MSKEEKIMMMRRIEGDFNNFFHFVNEERKYNICKYISNNFKKNYHELCLNGKNSKKILLFSFDLKEKKISEKLFLYLCKIRLICTS